MGFQITSQRANQFVWFNNNDNNNNNRVPGGRGGSEKLVSSNPITTHSGTGERETLNINVVGKKLKTS